MDKESLHILKCIQNSMALEGFDATDESSLEMERNFQAKGIDQQMTDVCRETDLECARTGERYYDVFLRNGKKKWGPEFPNKLP